MTTSRKFIQIADKKIAWILGDTTSWDKTDKSLFFTPTGDDFEWFYAQHCVSMLDNGDIMLFDNGTAKVKRIDNDNRVTGRSGIFQSCYLSYQYRRYDCIAGI